AAGSPFRRPRRRSMIRGISALRFGDSLSSLFSSSAKNASARSSRSGCRFCQTIGGISLSSPHADSTRRYTRNGSTPSSFFGAVALAQHALGEIAEQHVGAVQALDELVVGLLRQIKAGGVRGVLVADAVEAAAVAIDALGVAVGVLVAVVAVVPVEEVQAAVRPGLLHDRHEPRIVGGQEVGGRFGRVACAVALEDITVDAAAVDVAHVEPFAVIGRI